MIKVWISVGLNDGGGRRPQFPLASFDPAVLLLDGVSVSGAVLSVDEAALFEVAEVMETAAATAASWFCHIVALLWSV